jgi:SAM-dependent methyltransferase
MSRVDFINAVRREEMQRCLKAYSHLFAGKDLLEIGSGTGAQLELLATVCNSAVGIEVPDGPYSPSPNVRIIKYDGKHIPFPDASFDVIFSSNVMEHIADEGSIHREMKRVLRNGGVAVHILPSASWRVLTSLAHYPAMAKSLAAKISGGGSGNAGAETDTAAATPNSRNWHVMDVLLPGRHGEFGNRFSEYFLFRAKSWRRRFENYGWKVEAVAPVGLAYTGYQFLAERISLATRSSFSKVLGSSSVLWVMRAQPSPQPYHARPRVRPRITEDASFAFYLGLFLVVLTVGSVVEHSVEKIRNWFS